MSLTGFLSSSKSVMESMTKKPLSSFSFLETADGENTIIGKDGSMASVIRIDGIQRIVGNEELKSIIDEMNLNMGPYLGREGHTIQVWFCRDPDLAPNMVKDLVRPSRGVARRLGINLDDMFDAKEHILPKYVVWEGFYMVLWTRLSVLTKKESENVKADLAPPKFLPSFSDAQNFTKISRVIKDRHRSFVQNFLRDLKQVKLRASVLDTSEAIKVIKWSVYPDLVGADWKPSLPGSPINVREPTVGNFDASHMLWPRLDDQIFDREAVRMSPRVIQLGSKYFTGIDMTVGPQETPTFNQLLQRLVDDEFPWRISYMIDSDGLRSMNMKEFLASVFQFTNTDNNKPIQEAIKALKLEKQNGMTITKFRISFATWAPVGPEGLRLIEERASRLQRAVESWGYCHTSSLVGDPVAAVMSTSLGLQPASTAPAGAVPLPDVITMLPWNRDASPWKYGSVLFRTPDGRPWPYHPGSSLQDTWIDLIFAPPGKGKSVLMNTINLALCLSPSSTSGTGGVKLPRILIIDIGPSSSGLISVLQEALPPSRKHEVAYKRLRMTHEHSINPCDTQLGCRKLLPLEKSFLVNFLTTLATDPGATSAPIGLAGLLSVAIDAVYDKKSDSYRKGTPNKYNINVSRSVDRAMTKYAIPFDMNITTWWDVVDMLFEKGDIHNAILAQRHAVPRLEDFQAILFDEQVTDIHGTAISETGERVVDVAARAINTALREFPILQRPTNFDIGESRVVALDLDEVAPKGGGPADKQTALMYMLARFMARDFYLNPDVVSDIPEEYRSYHVPRIRRLKEEVKRIVYDEFHRTSNSESVRAQVLIDMREGRKYGVHVCLASQMLNDFDNDMIDMATGHWILGTGTEKSVIDTARQFGLSDTSTGIVRSRLNGPGAQGAPFLAVLKLKEGVHEHLLYNTLGPTEIWAFSTTAEDAALRNRLYELLGAVEARKRLSSRFPSGSAKSEIEKRVAIAIERGARNGDEAETGIIEELGNELFNMKM